MRNLGLRDRYFLLFDGLPAAAQWHPADYQCRSSDAKANSMEYHGMMWIFDQLVTKQLITKPTALQKLQQFITTNLLFQNNRQQVTKMEKRLTAWVKD